MYAILEPTIREPVLTMSLSKLPLAIREMLNSNGVGIYFPPLVVDRSSSRHVALLSTQRRSFSFSSGVS